MSVTSRFRAAPATCAVAIALVLGACNASVPTVSGKATPAPSATAQVTRAQAADPQLVAAGSALARAEADLTANPPPLTGSAAQEASMVGSELGAIDPAAGKKVARSLSALGSATAGKIARVAAAVRNAERVVEARAGDVTAYRASVVASLAVTAAQSYGEATASGTVTDTAGYRTASALASAARSRYGRISGAVQASSSSQAAEVSAALSALAQSLPAAPAQAPVDSGDVDASAATAALGLELSAGALFPGASNPRVVFDRLGQTYADALDAYEAGDADEASALLARAQNAYRGVEAEVASVSPEVNNDITLALEQASARIEAGAAQDEITSLIGHLSDLTSAAGTAISSESFNAAG